MEIFTRKIIIFFIVLLCIAGASFFLASGNNFQQSLQYIKKVFQTKQSPGNTAAPSESETAVVQPPELQDFEFQTQEATSTINVSWDGTKIDIFYIVLLDTEKLMSGKEESAIWAISSFKLDNPPVISLKKKDVPAFLFSPYTIGEKIKEFYSSKAETINLEQGREYYLQVVGFDKEGNLKASAKTFKFGP